MSTLEFLEINVNDSQLIKEYLEYDKSFCSDYTVGFVMMWKKTLNITYAISDGMLILKGVFHGGREKFYMPCGNGNFEKVFLKIVDYSKSKGSLPEFISISPLHFDSFKKLSQIKYTESRNYFDYVYSAESIALLKGRKYHQKRNHISNFKKKYKYSYNSQY